MKQRYTGVYPHGSIENGSIEIQFMYQGRRRETLNLSPTAANQAFADKLRRSITDRIALNQYTLEDYREQFPDSKWLKRRNHLSGAVRTVHEGLDDWFERKRSSFKPSTEKRVRSSVNVLKSSIDAKMLLTEFTAATGERLVSQWRTLKVTAKTIRNNLWPLKAMFSDAVRHQRISVNPLTDMERVNQQEWEKISKHVNKTIDPFDLTDLAKVLETATGQVKNFTQLDCWSGLRTGEMFAVAWEDVDFERKTVRVWTSSTERNLGLTKTSRERIVELANLPMAWEALLAQREHTSMLPPVDCGEFGKRRIIFNNPKSGKPWTDDNQFRETAWRPLLRKAGVRYRYPYQMRHTFASLAIAAGEPLKWIANQMGHVDETMVIKNYGKWLAEAAHAAGREGGSKMRNLTGMSGKNSGKIPAQSPFIVTNAD